MEMMSNSNRGVMSMETAIKSCFGGKVLLKPRLYYNKNPYEGVYFYEAGS